MNPELPFINWSLLKRIRREPLSLERAKIRILLTVLFFAIAKSVLVLLFALDEDQTLQMARAAILLALYIFCLQYLLNGRMGVRTLTHILLLAGVLVVWTNVFIAGQGVNVVLLQFVFMAMISSFYLLNRKLGIFYSILSSAPVVLYLLLTLENPHPFRTGPEELVAGGVIALVILNFLSIIMVHYLYHEAFSMNISEKEALNVRLKSAVEAANDLAQSKSDFLSVMSHELRTPLNSVIGVTDILLEEPHSDDQKKHLEVLHFSALNLNAIINNVLDFNRLDSDKLGLETISVNLSELIDNIILGLEWRAKEKGLRLFAEVDPLLLKNPVMSDPTRITQIIYNLAGNAIKFTDKGSVRIALSVIEKSTDKLRIRFVVEDTGIGISPEMQNHIFEPFAQAGPAITRNYGGSGLGLAIVKRLVDLFGSEISLKSGKGKGSVFSFEIDFAPEKNKNPSEANPLAEQDLSGLRVLIGEDHEFNVSLLSNRLSKWNVEYGIAVNGREVIERLLEADYDVILMDINMPEVNGYEATEEIRKLPPPKGNIPVIALTASVFGDVYKRVTDAGMNDIISKPFNARELFQKLKEIKEKKERESD